MNILQRAILLGSLLVVSCQVLAVSVESTTSIILSNRECVAGETACDSIGPAKAMIIDGLPGRAEAKATHEDPAFGKTAGAAKLRALPAISEHSARSSSLPGARNGGNAAILRKYTNSGTRAEIVTLTGILTYEQSVPEENSGFPLDSPGRSGAGAELVIGRLDVDAPEAGTTVEDNYRMLEVLEDTGFTELASDVSGPLSNVSDTGTRTFSVRVTVEAGDSIWLWAALQCIAANGAEVSATFLTELEARSAGSQ